jgi:formate dehydrogenase subunit gamma
MKSYLAEALSFSQEDWKWIKLMGGYFSKREIPPQGRMNAGPKLFYRTVLIFGVTISVSGFIMYFSPTSRTWMQIGHFLHNLASVVLISTFPLHVYLATAASPGSLRIMTRGTMPLKLAKKRHAKWVRQMGFD